MKIRCHDGEAGYFLFIAVFLILVMGLMGSLVAYLTAGRSRVSVDQWNGQRAFYLAESGLEVATRYLTRPSLGTAPARIACASVTGYGQLTNASLNGGTLTTSTVGTSPLFNVNTLNGAISAADTTLILSSSTGFASTGRVVIEREAIDYAAISGNSLIGVTRGVAGTTAATHASGARVGQYQCSLDVQAGIPSIASPSYQRNLRWNVQLQDGWAVSTVSGNNARLLNWNETAELAWSLLNVAGGSNAAPLNGISMLSNGDGWAVGNRANSSFILMRWNGSSWGMNAIAGSCSGQHLYGVSMVSTNYGFTVGARYRPACAGSGNFRYTIMYWNGSAWSLLTPSTSPSIPADGSALQDLHAVHVIDTNADGVANIGFAVGNSATILRFNGSNWVTDAAPSGVTQDLNGVYTVSSSEAWAVGQNGRILRWNGSAWANYTSPTSAMLNSVSMLDTNGDGLADMGFAVGNSGVVAQYNGSTWSVTDLGNRNLFGVDIFNHQDAWTVGGSGTMFHWDGNAWSSFDAPVNSAINAVSLVRSGQLEPVSNWQQLFK